MGPGLVLGKKVMKAVRSTVSVMFESALPQPINSEQLMLELVPLRKIKLQGIKM
jgi:hypothetical protein